MLTAFVSLSLLLLLLLIVKSHTTFTMPWPSMYFTAGIFVPTLKWQSVKVWYFSIMYGCETWVTQRRHVPRLEIFQRIKLCVGWLDNVVNVEVI